MERRRLDGVEPPGAVGPDGREAALPQDLEMLRDGGLRDPELVPDAGADRPVVELALGEELEDPAPDGIAENIERVHEHSVSARAYISQSCSLRPIRRLAGTRLQFAGRRPRQPVCERWA